MSQDNLRDRFSYSKVACAAKCLRQFFYRYVVRQKEPSGYGLIFGRAAHEAQEVDNYAKLGGEKLSVDQVVDAGVESFREEQTGLVLPDAEGGTALDRFSSDFGRQMAAFEASGARSEIQPVPGGIEAPFEYEVLVTPEVEDAQPEPATIEGFTDVVSLTEDGERRTVDYKSCGRPPTIAEHEIQLASEAVGGESSTMAIVAFVKAEKQKATTKVVGPVPVTDEAFAKAMQTFGEGIGAVRRALKSGDFPKCDPSAFYCRRGKACPYGAMCYPEPAQNVLKGLIEVTKIRPVGTVPTPDWRKSEAQRKFEQKGKE